jgi:hypothetical protein
LTCWQANGREDTDYSAGRQNADLKEASALRGGNLPPSGAYSAYD